MNPRELAVELPSRVKVAASVLVLMTACFACLPEDNAVHNKAEAIWRLHEAVFADLSQGRDVDAVKFDAACTFFYRLTKVEIPSSHNVVIDCYPTKNSWTALVPLREWYSRNGDRLYWDDAAKEVRLLPESR